MVSKRVKDLAERVALTFVGAFIGVYLLALAGASSATDTLSNKELLDNAITAGIAACVPLVSGLIGFRVGDKDTASIIRVKEKTTELVDKDVPQDSPAPLFRKEDEGE